MGGMQSSAHNLGDALWTQERQRQRSQRDSTRYENQTNQSTQERRKLLKRTRSLAVISEDTSRNIERGNRNFSLGEPSLEVPRRPQLIPRAKLIDRNSLKDRLSKSQQHLSETYDRYPEARPYHSHSTCDLHNDLQSITPALSYSQESSCNRVALRDDPDRLNILNWPRQQRRYRSHQDLDTVSGLVDIIEDNWPLNEPQRCDIYTQVKRKRKEHRSLDSILFEDEGELEYFDVLNLLPLSKVRLEFEDSDSKFRHGNFEISNLCNQVEENNNGCTTLRDVTEDSSNESEQRQTPRILQVSEFSDDNQDNTEHVGNNVTDEEKCKSNNNNNNTSKEINCEKIHTDEESWKSLISLSSRGAWETDSHRDSFDTVKEDTGSSELSEKEEVNSHCGKKVVSAFTRERKENHLLEKIVLDDSVVVERTKEKEIEEAEDYKSIWISDTDEIEDMSRRPQVLKVVDSDVTRRRSRAGNVLEIDVVAADVKKEPERYWGKDSYGGNVKTARDKKVEHEENSKEHSQICNRPSVELTRNFFEGKSIPKETTTKNEENEGRFERIVKETSSMIGKACDAVKGSLGFEARSESSDLGLGSDCGSDTRRRSIDDGVDVTDDITQSSHKNSQVDSEFEKSSNKSRTNLTRSRSCVNSIECQEADGPEFDHVRYKIVKSRLFGKNIFGNMPSKGDVGYEGLMEYLREYSFQELLLDNNVVIIEPVRAEPIEKKNSPSMNNKQKSLVSSKISSTVEEKIESENNQNNEKPLMENTKKIPKQSSLRKHFFYHPIRVNRELIDEELPDPDTVRNVRRMFEATFCPKNPSEIMRNDSKSRKSVSMKDLSSITSERRYDDVNEATLDVTRSRYSSRAKDLTRLFEDLDKSASNLPNGKEDISSSKCESKTRIIAQSFEARSGNTSPSDSGCARNKTSRYRQNIRPNRQQTNWDAGSVSSGVSSDYPDTDPGSGAQCTSSEEDEELDDVMRKSERVDVHFVSQDVLKKIREHGTSVTYYGGKVVNTCNGPLISPMSCKLVERNERNGLRLDDYVKFKLVKSNSCDSRLELAGRVIERRTRLEAKARENSENKTRSSDLRTCTIDETPSIEISGLENSNTRLDDERPILDSKESVVIRREPPVVIGLEPKKEENRDKNHFKADFKLGKIQDTRSSLVNRFGSALTQWQINETDWKKNQMDFGKMEFEEFEVLEDSLNNKK